MTTQYIQLHKYEPTEEPLYNTKLYKYEQPNRKPIYRLFSRTNNEFEGKHVIKMQ